jgi:hypothetical protein
MVSTKATGPHEKPTEAPRRPDRGGATRDPVKVVVASCVQSRPARRGSSHGNRHAHLAIVELDRQHHGANGVSALDPSTRAGAPTVTFNSRAVRNSERKYRPRVQHEPKRPARRGRFYVQTNQPVAKFEGNLRPRLRPSQQLRKNPSEQKEEKPGHFYNASGGISTSCPHILWAVNQSPTRRSVNMKGIWTRRSAARKCAE